MKKEQYWLFIDSGTFKGDCWDFDSFKELCEWFLNNDMPMEPGETYRVELYSGGPGMEG